MHSDTPLDTQVSPPVTPARAGGQGAAVSVIPAHAGTTEGVVFMAMTIARTTR